MSFIAESIYKDDKSKYIDPIITSVKDLLELTKSI